MLFCTSLLAFVGAGEQPQLTPRKLSLLNTHSNAIIQNLSFPSTVLGVQLNRKRWVAAVQLAHSLPAVLVKSDHSSESLASRPISPCFATLPAD
jgi:hypothetical protein